MFVIWYFIWGYFKDFISHWAYTYLVPLWWSAFGTSQQSLDSEIMVRKCGLGWQCADSYSVYRKFVLWSQWPIDSSWALFSKSEFVRYSETAYQFFDKPGLSRVEAGIVRLAAILGCLMLIGCYFRMLDADWMDDVCQRCSDSRQILQADVAERGFVRRESVVCGKAAIYSIDFGNVWCWL